MTAGEAYYIVADSADWPGAVTLNWRMVPPDNDDFESPESLWADGGSLAGVNAAATKQLGEPNHAGNPGGHSVWFSWTSLPGTVSSRPRAATSERCLRRTPGPRCRR